MILEKIDSKLIELAKQSDIDCQTLYNEIDEICLYNSNRILSAFIENQVSYSDFSDINGYGNYDAGRDKLEKIFADVLGCEDALVRPQIMSGTNALYLTLSALLKHGDTMISLSGAPYDSLQEMIGISGNSSQSLKAHGVKYEQIELINDDFDDQTIIERLKRNDVKLVEIQRSRGYSHRLSLSIKKIERIIKEIRKVNQDVIIMVDNCYGELVEKKRTRTHRSGCCRRFSNEKPWRWHCTYWWICSRKKRFDSRCSRTLNRSWHRKRFRCKLQLEQFILQRNLHGAKCCKRCFKNRNLLCLYVRKTRLCEYLTKI